MMYCPICGAEIHPGEDRCSICGAPVQMAQGTASGMQSEQPGYYESGYQQNSYRGFDAEENHEPCVYGPPAMMGGQQTGGKKSSGKKSGGRGKSFLYTLGVIILVSVVRVVTQEGLDRLFSSDRSSAPSSTVQITPKEVEIESEDKLEEEDGIPETMISGAGATVNELFEATEYGALFQQNRLYYGPLMVDLPGFELVQNDGSFLIDENGDNVIWPFTQSEHLVSYENSDEEGILESWYEDEDFDTVESVRFEKFYLDDLLPAVLYTVLVTDAGDPEPYYYTEAIVMNRETATKSVRIWLMSLTSDGYETAYSILKGLHLTDKNVAESGIEKAGAEAITEVY